MTRPVLVLSLLLLGSGFPSELKAQGAPSDGAKPTITFTKEFPGSQPAYYSISLSATGDSIYRTAPDDKQPVPFHLSEDSARQIFELAQKLNEFRGASWESNRKVAQMGKKIFSFQDGTEHTEVSFNHTENPDALALTGLFERLSNTQQHRDRLEYLVRFDKLGIVKELLQLEIDLDQGRLLEPALLQPTLEKIQSNKALVNVAHERAAMILAKLNSGKY